MGIPTCLRKVSVCVLLSEIKIFPHFARPPALHQASCVLTGHPQQLRAEDFIPPHPARTGSIGAVWGGR